MPIWADQFDADRSDLLEMQDDIVIRLSRALSIQLVDVELGRAMRTRPGNLEAQDLALQCLSNLIKSSDLEAVGPCRRALPRRRKCACAWSNGICQDLPSSHFAKRQSEKCHQAGRRKSRRGRSQPNPTFQTVTSRRPGS
jgi:hypothetical protein